MPDKEFSLQYPMFALKRPIGCYVGYAREDGAPQGVLVYTSLEKLKRYQERYEPDTLVKVFDSERMFRCFLKEAREQGLEVKFDKVPARKGMFRSLHTISAAVLLEHFLPPPAFVWGYPVYVLEHNGSNYACVEGSREGRSGMWMKVFTDSHLAERALARYREGAFTLREISRDDFEQMSRVLHTVCIGIVFDPPEVGQNRPPAYAMFCEDLVASFSIPL